MRKIRRKQEMQKRIIIISTICLFLCLCVGYAAFQTNISITAKGNVVCAGEDATNKILEDSLVISGSGIYVDSYENDRYVYRGADVDNYITFNNETWRIIAIESDGTLKIMRNSSIGYMEFDPVENRTAEYCSYYSSSGCNAWAATSNMLGSLSEFTNGDYSGTVEADSSLNIYLNGYYYDNLLSDAKSLIVDYTYNIGGVSFERSDGNSLTLGQQLQNEASYKWTGKVALINLSDIIRSNSNDEDDCNTLYGNHYYGNSVCSYTTWMYDSIEEGYSYWWTITPGGSNTYSVWMISRWYVFANSAYWELGVFPVVHLKANLHLTGSGTESEPYEIVDCN